MRKNYDYEELKPEAAKRLMKNRKEL